MRVSLEWLTEYVDISMEPDELARALSMSGTEVERIIDIRTGVEGVVLGRVVEVREHPGADHLMVAMVEDGSLVREIVCGAPNLRTDMKVALALPGARLPAVSEKELRRAEIRGVVSDGMLCSGAELGISEDRTGILELETDATIGSDLHEIIPMDDVVFELEITPNRPDCMSVMGIAREVGALTNQDLKVPRIEVLESAGPVTDLVKIVVKDTKSCPRYTGMVVKDVEVGPSQTWMQRRLTAAGYRPINNVVDVTNYVLVEIGQPLHAFDLDKLGENTIVVRNARYGEQLRTLDGVDRQLDNRSLVIADIEKPVALAGVMGGEDSEVTEGTTSVLIESANFNQTSILLTSKRLGLRTEASSRFERGVDPSVTLDAARRAAQLMVQQAGGRVADGFVDVYADPVTPVEIDLRPDRVNQVLGTNITEEQMVGILESLQLEVEVSGALTVMVPPFRRDLEREIDLIEEIARIFGYDRIPSRVAAGGGMDAGLTRTQGLKERMKSVLTAQGLLEVITYSFGSLTELDQFDIPEGHEMRRAVTIMNPLAETGEILRTTLIGGLVRVARTNINRGNRDLALFEIGKVFTEEDEQELVNEVEKVGILLSGNRVEPGWSELGAVYDFYDLKGTLENLADSLAIQNIDFEPDEQVYMVPGCCALVTIDGKPVGNAGQLHPVVAESLGLDGSFFVAELQTMPIIESSLVKRAYEPVGRYPTVKIDIAVVVDEESRAGRVHQLILEKGGELLRSARLFDVYRGSQIPQGKKSLAYALEFGSPEGTLTDAQANQVLGDIVEALGDRFGAFLRGEERPGGEAT